MNGDAVRWCSAWGIALASLNALTITPGTPVSSDVCSLGRELAVICFFNREFLLIKAVIQQLGQIFDRHDPSPAFGRAATARYGHVHRPAVIDRQLLAAFNIAAGEEEHAAALLGLQRRVDVEPI